MAKVSRVGAAIRFVVRDFVDFVLHQKKWWLTALLLTLVVFVGLILMNEPQGVRPIIYSLE